MRTAQQLDERALSNFVPKNFIYWVFTSQSYTPSGKNGAATVIMQAPRYEMFESL